MTPHSLPVRARYGVSVVSLKSDLCSAAVVVVMMVISWKTGEHSTVDHLWFKWWLVTSLSPSYYMNQFWLSSIEVLFIETNFSQIWIEVQFSFKRMHLKYCLHIGSHFVLACHLFVANPLSELVSAYLLSSGFLWTNFFEIKIQQLSFKKMHLKYCCHI